MPLRNVPETVSLTNAMLLPLAAILLLTPQPSQRADPGQLVRQIQQALDHDGGAGMEREWRAALRARPRDPLAILAVATIERNRYAYERADTLYNLLLAQRGGDSLIWRAASRLGRGSWRALGSDVAAADSLISLARNDARAAGHRGLEADAVLMLSQLRGRSRGPTVGRELLNTWWTLLEKKTPQDSSLWLCQNGVIDDQTGDTTGYGRVLRGAELAERTASWRVAGNCRLAIAQIALRRGYVQGATMPARLALQYFRHINYTLGVALASQWFGFVRVSANAHAEGRALLTEAVLAARKTRFESVEAWAYAGLAQHYLALGDLGHARRYAVAAAASHQRRGDLWGLANSAYFEASALAAGGDLEGAIARYAAATDAFVAARIPHQGVAALVGRISAELRLGRIDSAERTIAHGREFARSSDAWRATEEPQLRGVVAMRRGELVAADSFFRSSAFARHWRGGESGVGAVVLAAQEAQLALRANNLARADSALRHVLHSLERWRDAPMNQGLTASLAQLGSNWSSLDELYPDLVDQLVRRLRVTAAFDLVERVRAREVVERQLRVAAPIADSARALRVLRPGRGSSPVASLTDVRQALAADEAFVTFVLGVDDAPTSAIVVMRDTVRVLRMPGAVLLRPHIQRFVQLAAAGTAAPTSSRALGAALLDPIVALLPAAITRLVLSPDGDLHRIPFDALQLSDGRHAIERFAISVAPSATALFTLRATPPVASERVIALGDPRYAGPERNTGTRDILDSAFTTAVLPRLRYSGDEARRVARRGGANTLLLGAAATEHGLGRSLARGAAVLHVAAHGLVDDDSQFRTALALAPGDGDDGFLRPDEIAQLKLTGMLVVLSSCRSSAGVVLGGEGMRGLTAPLLEAGARAVVGTHWSIGDRSVVPFVDRFYLALASGARLDDALRQTKLAAIRAGVSIADWGSFAVTGDASMRISLRSAQTAAPAAWVPNAAQVRRASAPR